MNKLFVVLALCLVAVAAASVHAPPHVGESHMLFSAFMKQHGKTYSTPHEFNRRLAAFTQNLAHVKKHNAEAAAGKHTYTLAMNHLSDLTNEEYRQLLKTRATSKQHCMLRTTFQPASVKDLPTTVDWRTKGVVTPVKNQGQCGSCWSFSATGSMEGAHALSTGTLVSFSEQELVDCVDNGACTCDAGGEMQDGFAYVIQNGAEGESDYPYCACSKGKCHFSADKVKAHFTSYQNITSGDESALQAAVAARPGVSIAIDASSIQFQLYGGGVFNDPSCKNGINDLDHGVLIVGYGTDSGSDYWLVKNSWGPSWGLQGYIMMSRNKNNQCGVATDASFILV